jgi:hypothetical protein
MVVGPTGLASAVTGPIGATGPKGAAPIFGVAVICDQKTTGTNGGTFTLGAWRTRDLNTIVSTGVSGTTLAANQFTLTAGSYHVTGYAPAVNVNTHQTRIYDVTHSAAAILGGSSNAQGSSIETNSELSGILTPTMTTTYQLQHQGNKTQTANGFGVATSFSTFEVYSTVTIMKLS